MIITYFQEGEISNEKEINKYLLNNGVFNKYLIKKITKLSEKSNSLNKYLVDPTGGLHSCGVEKAA